MNTNNQTPGSFSSVQQVTNNATSWIGHRTYDNKDIVMGQTFMATTDGDVQAIEVFSSIVVKPGKVVLTLHAFDLQEKKWGPSLGSSTVEFNYASNEKWVAFNLPGVHLIKGKTYGFKLECTDTYIGVGEAAGSAKQPPFKTGQVWKFTNNNKAPDTYTYFSLAFKVDLKAA